jgi:hypothetical protein
MTRLWAQDEGDAAVISALMQDACVRLDEIAYDQPHRRFVIMSSRFCWEEQEPQRVRAALRIESVTGAKRRNWPERSDVPLELLALGVDDEEVLLHFAGGAEIRVQVECIDLILEDLGTPHPALTRPQHRE